MSHPSRSAPGRSAPSAVPGKRAGKLRKYKAPTILTYSDEHFLRELGPAKASGTSTKHA